jgi:hypothetical protein
MPNLLVRFTNGEVTTGRPIFHGTLGLRKRGHFVVPEWNEAGCYTAMYESWMRTRSPRSGHLQRRYFTSIFSAMYRMIECKKCAKSSCLRATERVQPKDPLVGSRTLLLIRLDLSHTDMARIPRV